MDRDARNNQVINVDYWEVVAKDKSWNRVCDGFPSEEAFYDFTEPISDLEKTMKFLDFGCGPGRIVKTVAPNVKEYVGVDVAEGLVALARGHHKEYKNVSFFKGNGQDLKMFKDNTFDYAYERLVFIHVPKEWIVAYIGEFYRVLKPGAILNIPDLPKDENMMNGFTPDEITSLFQKFTTVNIDTSTVFNNVRCIK